MSSWLAKTEVRHRQTGATGVILGVTDPPLMYHTPMVAWDHGATMPVDGWRLERNRTDWYTRAVWGVS